MGYDEANMRNRFLGAILIGLGAGLLINLWFPWLRWAWPLGLIAGGVVLWREIGPMSARIALITASLTVAIFGTGWNWGFDLNTGPGRKVAELESTREQQALWEKLERIEILNTVGNIVIEADDEVELNIGYYSSRSQARAPKTLQVKFDQASQTLRIIGIDPKLPEDERRGLRADIYLQAPKGVEVMVVNDVGDIKVENMGQLDIETNVGNIRARQIFGRAELRSDVGNITLENASQRIKARTRVGDISIKLDEPLNADVSAFSDVGNVKLSIPNDSNVTIKAYSGIRSIEGDLERIKANEGRLRVGSGEFTVELNTNNGEVRVEQR